MLIALAFGFLFWAGMMFRDREEAGFKFFVTFIVSVIAGLLVMLMTTFLYPKEAATRVTNLHALRDNTTTSGSVFLGTGNINERPVFTYYAKSDNGFRLDYTRADRSIIVETNGTPRLEQECTDYNGVPALLVWPISLVLDDGMECLGDYIFYVPPGSVVSDYVLDAQ